MTDEYFHCVLEHAQSHSLFSSKSTIFIHPRVYVHLIHLVFNIFICFDIDQSHIVTFGISLLEQLMH